MGTTVRNIPNCRHTFYVSKCDRADLPKTEFGANEYDEFWRVRLWDDEGRDVFYLGRGHNLGPREVVGWYRNGKMHSSFENTLKAAVAMMVKDGFLYAE